MEKVLFISAAGGSSRALWLPSNEIKAVKKSLFFYYSIGFIITHINTDIKHQPIKEDHGVTTEGVIPGQYPDVLQSKRSDDHHQH